MTVSVAMLASLLSATAPQATVGLCIPRNAPEPVVYGAEQLQAQWQGLGLTVRLHNLGPEERDGVMVLLVNERGYPDDVPASVSVHLPPEAESYAIVAVRQGRGGGVLYAILAHDQVGAMYGLLDLADALPALVAMTDRAPIDVFRDELEKHVCGTFRPALKFRAPNPFLSLPFPEDQPWWFLSEEYWTKYLDMLAHCHFNWLDIHGMYHIMRTNFPNIYPYFVRSKSFPEVGVPDAEKQRNLAMLKKVVAMAKRRGIKIALMSYHASWNVPGGRRAPYPETEENLAKYTRECVAALLKAVPDLGMVGFRIGESGRGEGFYQKSYLPGIDDSGLRIPLYTRSWGANRPAIIALGEQYPGRFFLEIKYNGEQYGLPYIVAGGRMARWRDYSYQDYCTYPRPYSIIWQIRANGTHRFFRWADPDYVRVTVRACQLDGAIGYSLEPEEAYYPLTDYYHRDDCGHGHPHWVMDRYWMWYLVWGRLTYNPNDRLWPAIAAARLGINEPAAASRYIERIKAASRIISYIYAVHCLGPDHRNMAAEMETGGNILEFSRVRPLDIFTIATVPEYVADVLLNRPNAKITPLQMADELERLAEMATSHDEQPLGTDEWKCWAWDNAAVAHLARYYAHKLRASVALEMFTRTGDEWQAAEAQRETAAAIEAWRNLCAVTRRHYKYVHDTLRMHDPQYHWCKKLADVERDRELLARRIEKVRAEFRKRGLGIGHVPVRRIVAGQNLVIEATALGNPAAQIDAYVELADGKWHRFAARKFYRGRAKVVVPAAKLPRGRVRYCLYVRQGIGDAWLPKDGKKQPFVVAVSHDGQPPRFVQPARAEVVESTKAEKKLRITAICEDADGIAKAWVWYKDFPSERRWRRKPAEIEKHGGQWTISADLTSTPEGIMYAVEVADGSGEAARSPAFDPRRPDIPYRWLDPWPGPVKERGGLSKLPAEALNRKRFSAMVLGREALAFARSSDEVKRQVLDAVRRGLSLIIFNQDFPGKFSYKWLPGKIEAGDADYNEAEVVGGHRLTEGLPKIIRGEKIVNDEITRAEGGWKVLTKPGGLAVYKLGEGYIIACQLRALQLNHQLEMVRLLKNIFDFARAGSDRPLLVLDAGNDDLPEVLSIMSLPYKEVSDLANE